MNACWHNTTTHTLSATIWGANVFKCVWKFILFGWESRAESFCFSVGLFDFSPSSQTQAQAHILHPAAEFMLNIWFLVSALLPVHRGPSSHRIEGMCVLCFCWPQIGFSAVFQFDDLRQMNGHLSTAKLWVKCKFWRFKKRRSFHFADFIYKSSRPSAFVRLKWIFVGIFTQISFSCWAVAVSLSVV